MINYNFFKCLKNLKTSRQLFYKCFKRSKVVFMPLFVRIDFTYLYRYIVYLYYNKPYNLEYVLHSYFYRKFNNVSNLIWFIIIYVSHYEMITIVNILISIVLLLFFEFYLYRHLAY